ncbi:AHH domain-containing protein [Archangium gephyra]|uniref:Lipoprotein n=2 Tax=Archangium gephyra TaxID=48 RepID=A0AAC8THM7_9BACT|nr:AHH domain-containing protein [Archangium gephyra]AKJ06015.1 putative lipoprotein [Archangium gephyra]
MALGLALTPAVEAATGVLRDFSAQAMTALLTGLSLYLEDGEEGQLHHIATVENETSTLRGGLWTQRLKTLFDKAGMSMEDVANKVRIRGHKGPHPEAYHQEVFDRLKSAVATCQTTAQCRESLKRQLRRLAEELQREGSRLNKLVTRSP